MQILFFAHLLKIWLQVQPQTLGLLSTDGAMEDLLLHFPLGYLDEDDHDDAYEERKKQKKLGLCLNALKHLR